MDNCLNNFEYKVSIIIPVYKVEAYLEECLNSLLAQTIPQEEMEVLMINDGSPDGSLAICERYAAQYPNFKVISQENQGVSAARNNGIRNARGKYLMYLDGDDTLSPETVKNVTDFFDRHYYETDVVTYPLSYNRNGEVSSHWRYQYLEETGVYDLDKFPYICQTTINICVKNKGAKNIFFDETLRSYEDQTYNLTQCMPLRRIGYCKEGTYWYYQRATGAVKQFSHPYYSWDLLLNTYGTFLSRYDRALYVQSIVLYDLAWRLRSDMLYPYHLPLVEMETFKSRFSHILDQIDTKTIMGFPALDAVHKIYLLSLKTKDRPFSAPSDDLLSIVNSKGTIWKSESVLAVINQCKVTQDQLYILAYLKELSFCFLEKPRLFAVLDGVYQEVPLFLSQGSCYLTKIRTSTFWGFHFQVDLNSFQELRFVVQLRGKEISVTNWFTGKQTIQPEIGRSYINGATRSVIADETQWTSVPRSSPALRAEERKFLGYLWQTDKKQWRAYKQYKKRSRQPVWLYQDVSGVVDNGYHQFCHDFDKQDGIHRYYVCKKDTIDCDALFTPRQRKALVEFGSEAHKRLFLQADKVLTSFIERPDFVPFDPDQLLYYRDLLHAEVIYLQHGVMHAKIPNMYSKESLYMIDRVVISTEFEKQNLTHQLAFREQDLICSGMPRFDLLEKKQPQKKVLFAPSWRYYLTERDSQRIAHPRAGFEKTDYYREVRDFLSDPRLDALLKEYGYRLDIKLHPNFKTAKPAFEPLETERIALVDRAELGEYAVCVTDFSSFMFDFLYLDIPVLSHIFDQDKLKAGLHSYREFFWDMEHDYPYYGKTIEELLALLERYMKEPGVFNEEFSKFTSSFFLARDHQNRERIYRCLKGE